MIIDDDDDLRKALTLIMSAHGYEVAAFGDARRALGALEGGTAPFLILLDLMMAGMSGWEFRAAQLENPKLTEIPVVVLTAANTLSDGVHTLSDVEIIPKPFALDALLAVVERYAGGAGRKFLNVPSPCPLDHFFLQPTLLRPQRSHRIDPRGAAGRHPGSQQAHREGQSPSCR